LYFHDYTVKVRAAAPMARMRAVKAFISGKIWQYAQATMGKPDE
jgi:hypothetical protein